MDPVKSFSAELYDLLNKFDMRIMGTNDGDVMLLDKDGCSLGCWNIEITEKGFLK